MKTHGNTPKKPLIRPQHIIASSSPPTPLGDRTRGHAAIYPARIMPAAAPDHKQTDDFRHPAVSLSRPYKL